MKELDKLQLILLDCGVESDSVREIVEKVKASKVTLETESINNISLIFQGIKTKRESLNVSQMAIAKHLGVAENTISAHEKQSYLSIKVKDGLKILRFLDEKEGKNP